MLLQSESYNETTYNVGDFVYVAPTPGYNNTSDATSGAENSGAAKTGALKPNVACIQKLWTDSDGIKMFEGIFFFRPDQTYHIPTRKFLQKVSTLSKHKLDPASGWALRHTNIVLFLTAGTFPKRSPYLSSYE